MSFQFIRLDLCQNLNQLLTIILLSLLSFPTSLCPSNLLGLVYAKTILVRTNNPVNTGDCTQSNVLVSKCSYHNTTVTLWLHLYRPNALKMHTKNKGEIWNNLYEETYQISTLNLLEKLCPPFKGQLVDWDMIATVR